MMLNKMEKINRIIKNIKSKRMLSLVFIFCIGIDMFAIAENNENNYKENVFYTNQIINNGKNKYKTVRLVPDIYNKSVNGISNLRLFDDQQKAVPYFVYNFVLNKEVNNVTYDLKSTRSFISKKNYYQEFALENIPDKKDIISNEITFETSKDNFTNKVQLLGSYDNKNWEVIEDGVLYKVANHSNLKISFNSEEKYKYFKLIIFDSDGKNVSFETATLVHNVTSIKKEEFLSKFEAKFTVKNEDKKTFVVIQGLKNLKINSIKIESDNIFSRKVNLGSEEFEIYNLNFSNVSYKNTTINMEASESFGDELSLIINNFDDTPITIDKVIIEYFVDVLVFEGSNNSKYFNLTYGDSKNIATPIYDIKNYSAEILRENKDELFLGESKEVKEVLDQLQQPKDLKWLMNLVIIFIAIILGVILLMKLKKKD